MPLFRAEYLRSGHPRHITFWVGDHLFSQQEAEMIAKNIVMVMVEALDKRAELVKVDRVASRPKGSATARVKARS